MAKIVLMDWQRGKIPFFVPPPNENVEIVENVENNIGDENKNKEVNFIYIVYIVWSTTGYD
jgi:nuclear GTP-binding protein